MAGLVVRGEAEGPVIEDLLDWEEESDRSNPVNFGAFTLVALIAFLLVLTVGLSIGTLSAIGVGALIILASFLVGLL